MLSSVRRAGLAPLERGGPPPPTHYARGRAALDLGGMMHPLSNHDMAKLLRAAGWASRAPPIARCRAAPGVPPASARSREKLA
jgi:hypothetical protein